MNCKVCNKAPEWDALDGNYCSLTCMADEATASYEASVLNAWNIVHDHIRTSMDGVQWNLIQSKRLWKGLTDYLRKLLIYSFTSWKNNRAKTLNNYHF